MDYIAQLQLYESKPTVIRSFGLRVAPFLESANIQKDKIEEHFVSEIPSWCIRKPEVNLTLHSGKKSESNPHLLKESFHQLQSQFINVFIRMVQKKKTKLVVLLLQTVIAKRYVYLMALLFSQRKLKL